MKSASAFLRKGKVFLQSRSKTAGKYGIGIATGPVYIVDNGDHVQIGERIREALNGSMENVSWPANQAEWKAIQTPMLEAVGVKSWATLAKGTKSVGLECDGLSVKMVPTSNYENKGGTSLPEKIIECEFANSELGSALMNAFDACI